jgi:hypothetical protein
MVPNSMHFSLLLPHFDSFNTDVIVIEWVGIA